MGRILILLAIGIGVYLWWQMAAVKSGRALRRTARPLQNDQLQALFGKLARAAGIDRVEVLVLPDRNPNGLATASGDIYVTQGFVDAFHRGEVTAKELASVAAHELGHLALGHMKRRMVQIGGTQAAHMVLGGILGRIIPYFGWYISAWLLNLVTARLSRKDEFEADAYATALMVRSGLGAEPQARLLEKLPALIPGADAARSWLSSHPPTEERAAVIRANALRWQDHAPELER
jgi:putative metalloprotease